MNTPGKNWLTRESRYLDHHITSCKDLTVNQLVPILWHVLEELKATRAKLEELEQTKADKEVH